MKSVDEIFREQDAHAKQFEGETPAGFDDVVRELAGLSEANYIFRRRPEAKRFKIPAAMLDKIVKKARTHTTPRKRLESSNRDASGPTARSTSSDSSADSSVFGDSNPRIADYEVGRALLEADDPLTLVEAALRAIGYAGDTSPALLTYIAIASRHQERPLNLHLLAPSATGKNYTVDAALALHPEEAYYKLSASSPRALIYTDESFEHKTVILAEADSIPVDGPAASALRSIAEDARMTYETVEKNSETGRFVARRIEREGPTGFIATGVRPLDRQMATRVLTVTLPDDPQQTAAVLASEAREAQGESQAQSVDCAPFHASQCWLAQHGEKRVIVPFAAVLASMIPTKATRIRRDYKQLLTVIKTLAFLGQRNRERDPQGRIIATFADYGRARALLAPLFDYIVSEGTTPALRRLVEAVPADGSEVTEKTLAEKLGLAASTVHYHVRRALAGGWLKNLETRRGVPTRLVRGEALPADTSALPTVGELMVRLEASKSGSSVRVPENDSNRNSNRRNPYCEKAFDSAVRGFEPFSDDDDICTNSTPEPCPHGGDPIRCSECSVDAFALHDEDDFEVGDDA
jgi:DNA-binding MarR family transcriptional regulator